MPEGLKEKITSNKKIIWLIILLLLLILAALLFYFFRKSNVVLPTNQPANINQVVPVVTVPSTFNTPSSEVVAEVSGLNNLPAVATPAEQADVLFTANAFAERFGSYSNQSAFSNLDQLETFMTQSMNNWVKIYKEELRTKYPDPNVYYAIETKAISTDTSGFEQASGKGDVIVKTQRQEFKASPVNPKVFYQNIRLNLLLESGVWKVNGAYWQ